MDKLNQELLVRIARLEGALGWQKKAIPLDGKSFLLAFALGAAGTYCGLIGLGYPNHYYQAVIATLIVIVGYQREFFSRPMKVWEWSLSFVNIAALTVILKLILGGGERFPFHWMKYPFLRSAQPKNKLLNLLPEWNLTWESTELALWSLDLTVIQSFLLVLIVLGAMFGFQLFVSLIGFVLVIVSLPALVGFEWAWVFPSILCIGCSLYLQSSRSNWKPSQST